MNTDNKARLKPCPFCGSTKVHMEGHHWIMCAECLADGPGILGTTEAEAIEAWNLRIEAAGLLAGSVGVPSVEEIEEILAKNSVTKAPESMEDFGSFWRPDFQKYIAKTIHAHLLTRSPEPKGRWISEELAKELVKDLIDLSNRLSKVTHETYWNQIGDRIQALRAAPRAKEE